MMNINEKDNHLAIGHHENSSGRMMKRIITGVLVLLMLGIVGYLIAQHFLTETRQEELFRQHFNELAISTTPISKEQRDEYQVAPDRPRYIYIPTISVNQARVLALGLKAAGVDGRQQLDVPKNIDDVGWYDCGINPVAKKRCDQPTLPGAGDTETAAMLTGHTCFSRSMSCVFDKLSRLKRGDTITIELGSGEKINYVVHQVEILKLTDVDMAKAMRPIEPNKEGLTLITCAGTYRGAVDADGVPTADKRVLVYAVRVGE
ncbi:class F sortase [Candidatus Saccharibacteria bacterium]|nr:class F sortase [Candidatus Saccharibacteria bacterium]